MKENEIKKKINLHLFEILFPPLLPRTVEQYSAAAVTWF